MRVIVVKSDRVQSKLIRVALSAAGHDMVLAPTAAEARAVISSLPADVVLLDVDLPDGDGCELCQDLRERHFAGPVLFVSRRPDTKDKLRAFEYGADDYLVEPFDPRELVARIEVVARRCRHHDAQTAQSRLKVGDAELLISDLSYQSTGQPGVLLTPTEMRLLECLMRNVNQTVSRETLIERTWGYDFLGDSNRVEVYVARLRKKIEPNPSEPRYLHTIRGLGYMFRAVSPSPVNMTGRHESPVSEVGRSAQLPHHLVQVSVEAMRQPAAFER